MNLNSSQIVPYAPFSIWQISTTEAAAAAPVGRPIQIPDENVRVYLSLSLRPARNRCLHPRRTAPRRFARLRILGRHDALLARMPAPCGSTCPLTTSTGGAFCRSKYGISPEAGPPPEPVKGLYRTAARQLRQMIVAMHESSAPLHRAAAECRRSRSAELSCGARESARRDVRTEPPGPERAQYRWPRRTHADRTDTQCQSRPGRPPTAPATHTIDAIATVGRPRLRSVLGSWLSCSGRMALDTLRRAGMTSLSRSPRLSSSARNRSLMSRTSSPRPCRAAGRDENS